MYLFVFLLKWWMWYFRGNNNWDLHEVSERVTCEPHSSLQQPIKAGNLIKMTFFLMLWAEQNICNTESVSEWLIYFTQKTSDLHYKLAEIEFFIARWAGGCIWTVMGTCESNCCRMELWRLNYNDTTFLTLTGKLQFIGAEFLQHRETF